jgi:hypothetical protein
VPKEARWEHLKASAPQAAIGTIVDDAMSAIERDNPSLKGVLPKDFARPGLSCHDGRASIGKWCCVAGKQHAASWRIMRKLRYNSRYR